jgi:hypothetical protein|tara:strand:- start:284 stop:391 length:108 start_codon:yes stop_codon:yes gene_type:complete|eukprot:CAMPEP_0119212584 /NCGR_PEP_ID=MMETSP1327-20130426/4660_1 /TAXON_ID=38833 /ORGANISM="Micromonas pusilla, Strain RCC2306" /LENGTH=35 /DNA_ID= /DNA_START= /DNA_END= /DNA_ORIENTATION=
MQHGFDVEPLRRGGGGDVFVGKFSQNRGFPGVVQA